MSDIKRSWDRLNQEDKAKIKEELIYFFESERGEKIGVIAAEELLDFFLQSAGSKLYNQGVEAARKAMESRFEEMKYDLDDLIQD